MSRLDCLEHRFKHPAILRCNQNHLAHVVYRQELERIEQERDIGQREHALGPIATHRLESIVEGLSKQDCLHAANLVLHFLVL